MFNTKVGIDFKFLLVGAEIWNHKRGYVIIEDVYGNKGVQCKRCDKRIFKQGILDSIYFNPKFKIVCCQNVEKFAGTQIDRWLLNDYHDQIISPMKRFKFTAHCRYHPEEEVIFLLPSKDLKIPVCPKCMAEQNHAYVKYSKVGKKDPDKYSVTTLRKWLHDSNYEFIEFSRKGYYKVFHVRCKLCGKIYHPKSQSDLKNRLLKKCSRCARCRVGQIVGYLHILRYENISNLNNNVHVLCTNCNTQYFNKPLCELKRQKVGKCMICSTKDRKIDLIGKRFGRLTVISDNSAPHHKQTMYRCNCACGETTMVSYIHLVTEHTRSCGCLRKEQFGDRSRTHGHSGSIEYNTWCGMKDRVYNPKGDFYHHYGKAGVTIDTAWDNDYMEFYNALGDRPLKYSIDRINPYGDYKASNCRWADASVQSRNHRRYRTDLDPMRNPELLKDRNSYNLNEHGIKVLPGYIYTYIRDATGAIEAVDIKADRNDLNSLGIVQL
ncbi:MAG: hypothetical protein GY804_08755 [Alphaproteobacteria bacterium]|nr:hypothetical protein [Alphaproteobacteria bacterium]